MDYNHPPRGCLFEAESGQPGQPPVNTTQDPSASPSMRWCATVEDEIDEEMILEPNISQRTAYEAVKNAEEAARILDTLEERAQAAYGNYQIALDLAKGADSKALAALYVAKTTKDAYERVLLSGYHDAAQKAEDKAVTSVQHAKRRSAELQTSIENLKQLLDSWEQAAIL